MSRPLMTKGIEQLEQLFKDAAGDLKLLRRLADELACRTTTRASSLLAAVQLALRAQGDAPTDVAQPRLTGGATQLPLLPGMESGAPSTAPEVRSKQERPAGIGLTAPIPTGKGPPQTSVDVPDSAMTLEAAYRSLKLSSAASWSAIESARREIVQKATPEALEGEPSSSRVAIVERAAKANEASARLWRERYPHLA